MIDHKIIGPELLTRNNMKTYYKVLDYDQKSICTNDFFIPKSWRVKYTTGKWTCALIPETSLFVFDNLENAKKFLTLECFGEGYIWSCNIKYRTKVPEFINNIGGNRANDFWQNILKLRKQRKKIDVPQGKKVPKGTVCAKQVMILSKVC